MLDEIFARVRLVTMRSIHAEIVKPSVFADLTQALPKIVLLTDARFAPSVYNRTLLDLVERAGPIASVRRGEIQI